MTPAQSVRATGARTPVFIVFGCVPRRMRDCYEKQEPDVVWSPDQTTAADRQVSSAEC